MTEYDKIAQIFHWMSGDIKRLCKEVEELKESVQRKAELTQMLAVRQTLKNQRLEEELAKRVVVEVKVCDDR